MKKKMWMTGLSTARFTWRANYVLKPKPGPDSGDWRLFSCPAPWKARRRVQIPRAQLVNSGLPKYNRSIEYLSSGRRRDVRFG